jgi:hypothetical protein
MPQVAGPEDKRSGTTSMTDKLARHSRRAPDEGGAGSDVRSSSRRRRTCQAVQGI